MGPSAKYLHRGLTSSDVLDTALALQMMEAADILENGLTELSRTVAALARKYQHTLTIGRTHGIHAEPTTFGLKLAGWHSELLRALNRLAQAKAAISFGKISGAVGTYAHLDPQIEKEVCRKLGLNAEPVSTQIVPRDRHAEFVSVLAIIGCSLERFATEIRHLQRTEVLEAEEPFTEGQRGSSAMPHKRNPILSENICGLARLLRSYAGAAMENVALWHERDISHSSVERVMLPDATIALDFMIHRMNTVLKGLNVYPDRMKENMKKTALVIASQRLLIAMIDSGKKISREDAYKLVQRNAQTAWTRKEDFQSLILADREIGKFLSPKQIKDCFDLSYYTRHTTQIFKKAGLA